MNLRRNDLSESNFQENENSEFFKGEKTFKKNLSNPNLTILSDNQIMAGPTDLHLDISRFMDRNLNKFNYSEEDGQIPPTKQSLLDKNIFTLNDLYEKDHNENTVKFPPDQLQKPVQKKESKNYIHQDTHKLEVKEDFSLPNDFQKFNLMQSSLLNTESVITDLPTQLVKETSDDVTLNYVETNFVPKPEQGVLKPFKDPNLKSDQTSTIAEPDIRFITEKHFVSKSNKYMLMRTIGRGNFAKVKLAKHMTTEKLVAIKIIDKTKLSSKILTKVCREVNLMKQINHPNIIKLLEVMENESTLYLVLEYASGGELFDHLVVHGCMKEKEARIKFRQMVSAIHYCHSKFIVHRDLKAENVLLNNKMEIKIADFGFANKFDPNSKLSTFCGSPPYAAPELFQGQRYVGPEVDVWSLGVILFTLVSGRLPFDANTLKELKEKVLNLRYEFPYFISNDCERLLRKMLIVNPKDRATLESILNDPWINGGGLPKLIPHEEIQETEIDKSKLIKLNLMGYDSEEIIKSVKEKKYNAIYATYHLIDDSTKDSNQKLDIKINKSEINFSEKDQISGQSKTLKDESESISEMEKTFKDMNSFSLSGASASQLAKSFKKWFTKRHDNVDQLNPDETLDTVSGSALSKELQKQLLLAQSLDPNMSIPKGVNQQALLLTLNQMSWAKGGKAAMFQHETLGSSNIQKPMLDKSQITAAPILLQSEFSFKRHSTDSNPPSKFTVQNIKLNPVAQTVPSADLDTELKPEETIPGSSTNKKINILSILNKTFSKKYKGADEEKSEREKTSKLQVPAFIGKYDFSQLIKPPKHKHHDHTDMLSPSRKPRIERFAFSLSTTSSKDPDSIMTEIIRVLNENGFRHEFVEKYLLLCWNDTLENENYTDSVQWEIEVCRIPLLFMHAVRMKRIFGSSFAYKEIALKITRAMKL